MRWTSFIHFCPYLYMQVTSTILILLISATMSQGFQDGSVIMRGSFRVKEESYTYQVKRVQDRPVNDQLRAKRTLDGGNSIEIGNDNFLPITAITLLAIKIIAAILSALLSS